jgi:hypothetical protein
MNARIVDRVTDIARRWLLAATLGLILAGPLAAQCAMCRESAAYQRQEAIDSLRRGILVLAFPPLAIIVGIACLTYRYRGTPHGADDRPVPGDEQ